jgi:flagellar biosynthetic protein FliO
MGASAGDLPGLGGSLALSLVSLGVVCLLAYVIMRWLSRRGVGHAEGPVRVVARCPLEPRRAVYLLEAGGRCFLVGVGDGPISMLAELDPTTVKTEIGDAARGRAGVRFRDLLARLRTKEKS